jgi:hypothetical protein
MALVVAVDALVVYWVLPLLLAQVAHEQQVGSKLLERSPCVVESWQVHDAKHMSRRCATRAVDELGQNIRHGHAMRMLQANRALLTTGSNPFAQSAALKTNELKKLTLGILVSSASVRSDAYTKPSRSAATDFFRLTALWSTSTSDTKAFLKLPSFVWFTRWTA